MKMNLYSIRDNVAEEFGPIFQAKNHAIAKRNFINLIDENKGMSKEDYQIVSMGTFDTETGEIAIEKVGDDDKQLDFELE